MSDAKNTTKKLALALVAVIAVVAALGLLFWAAFPYFYAESGSSRYASEHRAEAIGEVTAAGVLLFIAWQCMRRSLSGRTWGIIGALALAAACLPGVSAYFKTPENARPIGDNWYVTATKAPSEADTGYYRLFYKRRAHFQPIEDLVGDYRFVPPDCVMYHGLKVVRGPLYVMCGYRAPIESDDSTVTESQLLAKARSRPPYRYDWRTIR